jgi:hypothetical protein
MPIPPKAMNPAPIKVMMPINSTQPLVPRSASIISAVMPCPAGATSSTFACGGA